MADILDQFETKRKEQVAAEKSAPEREYLAFRAVDKRQFRLRVCPADDIWDRLPYRMLLRIMEPGLEGTAITLVYSFMAVEIVGKNLRDVATAIERELCDIVEAFDPLRHDKPADPNAPFIQKIVLHAAAGMETMGKPPGKSREE